MITDRGTMKTEVIFSDDRQNRYLLRKEWDVKKPKATIIMTNPSAADLVTLDYTTLYILNNLAKLDYGAVDIVNLVSKITSKLDVKKDISKLSDAENTTQILRSAEKSDSVIIAWGKLGENSKNVRELQDKLLEEFKPFKDKLFIIANEKGLSGFHPLAPQIRFAWYLKKYEIPEKKQEKPVVNEPKNQ